MVELRKRDFESITDNADNVGMDFLAFVVAFDGERNLLPFNHADKKSVRPFASVLDFNDMMARKQITEFAILERPVLMHTRVLNGTRGS